MQLSFPNERLVDTPAVINTRLRINPRETLGLDHHRIVLRVICICRTVQYKLLISDGTSG